MRHVATIQGDTNLGTGDGLLIARIMAAVAANESDAKSRRVRRKMQENAEHGRPHGGAARPFGYEDDKVTVRPAEADVIRDLAARLLAGESLASLTRWLTDQSIPTATGKPTWRTDTVRSLLRSGRISGQREHRGELVGPAVWPAIITPEQTARIRALLDDPIRRTNRTARRYLLAGLLRCDACGATLLSQPKGEVRRYVCKRDANSSGCGRTAIAADLVEQRITEAVVHRLSSPQLAAVVSGQDDGADQRAEQLRKQITADRAQLEELARMWANGEITTAEWKAARDPIEARIKTNERELARLTNTSALDEYLGHADRLEADWSSLTLTRQVVIIKAVLDHAVIAKPRFAGRFDPDRIRPVWRI